MSLLNKMPEHWNVVQLGEIANFINGDRGKNYPSQDDFVDTGIPFINAGHIQNGSIHFESMNYISRERFNILGSGKVQSGDILYCLRGSLGKTAIIKEAYEGAIASSLVIIRPFNKVSADYLFYFLTSPLGQSEIHKYDNGSSQPNLSAKSVKEYKLPLPPLEEQQRIAAILDKANGVRRKRKEAIALTEELLRSAFLDMFGDPVTNPKGWEIKPLGEVAQFVGGGTPSRKVPRYFEGKICWATSKDMGVDILMDTEEHITAEAIEDSATKLVQPECLLIVVKSKVLMHRLPVARTIVPTCFGQDLKAIVPFNSEMTRYLHRHLKIGQKILLQQARGVNTEGLTLDHLRSFPVMMPSPREIEKFVSLDIQLENAHKTLSSSNEESHNLFNALLQRAFRGEL